MKRADFSYKKCSAGFSRGNGYSATRSDGGTISLRTLECEQLLRTQDNPLGWKFHISIDDEIDNMIRAWDSITPIFIRNRVSFIKFIRPESHQDDQHSVAERGRQFTIYIEQNPEKSQDDWQNLINEITAMLVSENIKPGYQNVVAKAVPGSSYFYYRNDIPPAPKDETVNEGSPRGSPRESPLGSPRESTRGSPRESPLESPQESPRGSLPASRSTIKPAAVPSLNLPAQSWAIKPTKAKAATAKATYLDSSIKIKHNPSNANEGFLSELKVENNNQLKPKEAFTRTTEMTSK